MTLSIDGRLSELIANSKVAFVNGQHHEAFNLAQEAIKLVESFTSFFYILGKFS